MSEEIEKELNSEELSESDAYRVKLKNYDGPLDLLLDLVKKAKIDIHDIFVSEITEQYLFYMEEIKEVDLDKASEFIEIAAMLLEIKSRSLLPKPEVGTDNDHDDPKKDLIRRLEEYKLYKEASLKMKDLETVGLHYREPDSSVGDVKFVLKDMTMDGLMKALQKLLLKLDKRAERPVERKIVLDRYTVSDMIARIRDLVSERDEDLSFFDLFESDYTKSEIITTFQALLELLKLQFVKVKQESTFSEIFIHKVAS